MLKKVDHRIFGRFSRPKLSEDTPFGISNLAVLEKLSAEKRAHPCADSTRLTVFYVADTLHVEWMHSVQKTRPDAADASHAVGELDCELRVL